jgi:purine-binding chemotaxis protein CheW
MAVSQAPNMTFDLGDVPEYTRAFLTKGRSGYGFSQAIKDSIVFEYHDILNDNPLPDLDIILVRDVLSFIPEQDQKRLVNGFKEKLKSKGMVILGRNEILPGYDWEFVGKEPVSVFVHT